MHGAPKPSLVRVYKTMGDYRRCKASARGARLGATQVLSLLRRWKMAHKLWSQHMSVIQFHEELSHLKKDGSGGKKKAPQYCQTFKAEKCGSLRQKEKSWCNFITPLNGFLITAAPFFRSNFAVLGKSCFVWGLCPDEEIMSQSLYLQSRGSQRTWVILIKDFKHNFVTPTASQILWLD